MENTKEADKDHSSDEASNPVNQEKGGKVDPGHNASATNDSNLPKLDETERENNKPLIEETEVLVVQQSGGSKVEEPPSSTLSPTEGGKPNEASDGLVVEKESSLASANNPLASEPQGEENVKGPSEEKPKDSSKDPHEDNFVISSDVPADSSVTSSDVPADSTIAPSDSSTADANDAENTDGMVSSNETGQQKKKSFFPRIFMFLARRKQSSKTSEASDDAGTSK